MITQQLNNCVANSIAIIDLNKVKENISKINYFIGQACELMPVLKGNAYGHGIVEIAKYITNECKIKKIAVAELKEAVQLRKAGIESMLFILGGIPYNNIQAIVENNVTVPVFTKEFAERLSQASIESDKQIKVHIKIDTGLKRIGVQVGDELQKLIDNIKDLKGIRIEGIFTHFSESEIIDKSFSLKQLQLFNKAIKQVKENGIEIKYCHCANSAAISDIPESHFNLVRPGGLYLGYDPCLGAYNKLGLEFAITWKAWITNVKYVEAEECVGYNRRYKAKSKKKIATLSFGFGDGYFYNLLNRDGEVIIRGKKAPIIGLCMDQAFVDVSSIEDVRINDEAILLGKDADSEINAFDIARKLDCPYVNILCNIGNRVTRQYLR